MCVFDLMELVSEALQPQSGLIHKQVFDPPRYPNVASYWYWRHFEVFTIYCLSRFFVSPDFFHPAPEWLPRASRLLRGLFSREEVIFPNACFFLWLFFDGRKPANQFPSISFHPQLFKITVSFYHSCVKHQTENWHLIAEKCPKVGFWFIQKGQLVGPFVSETKLAHK